MRAELVAELAVVAQARGQAHVAAEAGAETDRDTVAFDRLARGGERRLRRADVRGVDHLIVDMMIAQPADARLRKPHALAVGLVDTREARTDSRHQRAGGTRV